MDHVEVQDHLTADQDLEDHLMVSNPLEVTVAVQDLDLDPMDPLMTILTILEDLLVVVEEDGVEVVEAVAVLMVLHQEVVDKDVKMPTIAPTYTISF